MNTTSDDIDLMAMVVEVCVMETGVSGSDWRLKLHAPMQLTPEVVEEQVHLFRDKWDVIRPDGPVEWSD
eukprot:10016130-Prorocentrum_lima.AAC.1